MEASTPTTRNRPEPPIRARSQPFPLTAQTSRCQESWNPRRTSPMASPRCTLPSLAVRSRRSRAKPTSAMRSPPKRSPRSSSGSSPTWTEYLWHNETRCPRSREATTWLSERTPSRHAWLRPSKAAIAERPRKRFEHVRNARNSYPRATPSPCLRAQATRSQQARRTPAARAVWAERAGSCCRPRRNFGMLGSQPYWGHESLWKSQWGLVTVDLLSWTQERSWP